jgi:hypothetical protein
LRQHQKHERDHRDDREGFQSPVSVGGHPAATSTRFWLAINAATSQ